MTDKERIRQRIEDLTKHYQENEQQLRAMATRVSELEQTQLRIKGALDVLGEFLAQPEKEDQ